VSFGRIRAGIERRRCWRLFPDFQQNCILLVCPLWLPLRSLQGVNSLLKNFNLLLQNRRLLEQFGMEFIEFGKSLEFQGRRLRKQVAENNGLLTSLTGWGRLRGDQAARCGRV